jgi:murein DD-endopeptidase MepM/ murein hydrolase activator NlpD
VASGYDLANTDRLQRRGKMRAVGHGGIDLVAARGTPIRMVPLEYQVGDAEILYVGWLFGTTVVTRHAIREPGDVHDYVLLFAHLQRVAPGVVRGSVLRADDLVGYVGDTASRGRPHLHLEARRVKEGVDAWGVIGWELKAREVSIVTDLRNLLPVRGAREEVRLVESAVYR